MNFRQRFKPFLAPDAGKGEPGGGNPDPTPLDLPAKIPAGTNLPTAEDFAKLKSDYEHMLTVHLDMKAKYEKREKADSKAAEEALAKQGEFKTLYETAKAELEPLKIERDAQAAVIKEYYEAEIKGLDKAILEVIPDGNDVAKLKWLAKAKASGIIGTKQATAAGDRTPAPGKKADPSGIRALFKK